MRVWFIIYKYDQEAKSALENNIMTIRLGFVVAEFNRDLTYQMELLGIEHAKFLGAEVTDTVLVPGVYDMPLAIKKLCEKNDIDAVVTIGSVIEGATGHDEIVVQHASRKITDLSLEYNKPVTLGIAGPGMSRMEAHQRVDYAKRAVEAAVKLIRRL
ncbi:6,7-dimethyl-8-ribityllumazine synthase [Methanohalophilus halophilus]|uniref:6,7-dimethyl-8-ribityllumazine synthase n=2 Tax=Methanohalophilus halophilus TaxID=2177 RepID=A0A1H2XUY2_9EURY|nr:6,7-dimethyl-8-ribityllumazine synthase [Methanohalophilus halophilus]